MVNDPEKQGATWIALNGLDLNNTGDIILIYTTSKIIDHTILLTSQANPARMKSWQSTKTGWLLFLIKIWI